MYKAMDNVRMDALLKGIKERRELEHKFYSVTKLLNQYNMGMYANSCCDRIVDAELIDGEHILLNMFGTLDVLLDYEGMCQCEDILNGYIPADTLKDYMVYIKNEIIDIQNNQLSYLRNTESKVIKNIMRNPPKYFGDDAECMCAIIKAELKARNPLNNCLNLVRGIFDRIAFEIANYGRIRAIKDIVKEHEQGNT